MFKKAQGISMNVIIIAAIALLVLVVLSIIFLGRIGDFSETTIDCEANGGRCLDSCGEPGYEDYSLPYGSWTCGVDDPRTCCIRA